MPLLRPSACERAHVLWNCGLRYGLFTAWLALVACTEPHFEDSHEDGGGGDAAPDDAMDGRGVAVVADARSADAQGSDAGADDAMVAEEPRQDASQDAANLGESDGATQPVGDVPSWAPALDGQYAMRATSFAVEMATLMTGRLIQFVTIAHQGNAYELTMQHCAWSADTLLGALKVIEPSRLELLRQHLRFDGDAFFSEPIDFALGYEQQVPECVEPGQQLTKRGHQTWIAGPTCVCPGPAAVPQDENDCRITDPDDDGRPGFSTHFTNVPLGDADVWGVSTYYSSFVQGRRAEGGKLLAHVKGNEQYRQLGCSLGSNPSACLQFSGTAAFCPPEYNLAEFAPLAALALPSGGWSCEAILARLGQVFPTPEPAPPTSCAR